MWTGIGNGRWRWVIPSAVPLLSERFCAEENMFLHLCAMPQSCVSEIQMTACIYTWGRFDLYLRTGERFTSETVQILSASRHLHHELSVHSFDGYRLWLRFRSISINVDFIITQAALIRRFSWRNAHTSTQCFFYLPPLFSFSLPPRLPPRASIVQLIDDWLVVDWSFIDWSFVHLLSADWMVVHDWSFVDGSFVGWSFPDWSFVDLIFADLLVCGLMVADRSFVNWSFADWSFLDGSFGGWSFADWSFVDV